MLVVFGGNSGVGLQLGPSPRANSLLLYVRILGECMALLASGSDPTAQWT